MTKKSPVKFKKQDKKSVSAEVKQKNRDHLYKAGQSGNPAGRPKGSRNKFAEEFLADFLADWTEHGAAAIAKAREADPLGYVKVGVAILPKQLDISTDKAAINKLLETMDGTELDKLIAGLVAAGTAELSKAEAAERPARSQSNKLH